MALEDTHVLQLHRMPAPDLSLNARHGIRMTGAFERRSRIVDIDAFERRGEAVGVALAADLAVGDDVEAGLLLRADGEQRGVVLRFGETDLRYPPELSCAHARRKAAGEPLAVDQPFRLWITADQRGRKEHQTFSCPATNFGDVRRRRSGSMRPLR